MTDTSVAQAGRINTEEYDLLILGGGHGINGCRVDICLRRKTRRRCRPQIHWRIVPEYRLLTEQERHSQCQGRVVLSPKQRIWHQRQRLHDRHVGSPGAQAQDGARPQRNVFGELQEHGGGVHFGDGKVHSSENSGGGARRRDDSSPQWRECDRQHWYASHAGTNSGACRSATAHPRRGAGTRRWSCRRRCAVSAAE